MKNKWLDNVEIPDKYLISKKEVEEEQRNKYKVFKKELLNMFPELTEEKIKEIYNEKFENI